MKILLRPNLVEKQYFQAHNTFVLKEAVVAQATEPRIPHQTIAFPLRPEAIPASLNVNVNVPCSPFPRSLGLLHSAARMFEVPEVPPHIPRSRNERGETQHRTNRHRD